MKAPLKEKSKIPLRKSSESRQGSKFKSLDHKPSARGNFRGGKSTPNRVDKVGIPKGERRISEFKPRRHSVGGESEHTAWLYGRREVIELLQSGVKTREVLVLRSGQGSTFDEILELTEAKGIPTRFAERHEFDKMFPGETHQGVAAAFFPRPPASLEEFIEMTGPRLIVMLDGIEDPHNLGAVIRSAEVFGADGVVIPERRAASVNPTVIKTSAGAALRIPTASIGNLAQGIRRLKEAGYWIYGLDPEAKSSLWVTNFADRVCVVFGSEGQGLAALTRKLCDQLIAIPQRGRIGSLNISASAAVVLAELSRKCENMSKIVDL